MAWECVLIYSSRKQGPGINDGVQVYNEDINIDQQLLFQRLVMSSVNNSNLKYLTHEIENISRDM